MLSSTSRAASRMIAATRASTAFGSASTQVRSYHENIVEHYENPRNVGSLDKDDESVGTVSNVCLFVEEENLLQIGIE
jgi:nitrogen fixation NifU-like protein